MDKLQFEQHVSYKLRDFTVNFDLFDKDEGQSKAVSGDAARHTLIVIPGAIRTGEWTERWRNYAPDGLPEIELVEVGHGIIGLIRVLTGLRDLKLIHEKRQELQKVILQRPGGEFSIVCHSFGCYILSWVMKFGLPTKPKYVFIMGSSLRRRDIDPISSGAQNVVVELGTHDWAGLFLNLFGFLRFEYTSVTGFKRGHSNVRERRFSGGHSLGTDVKHLKKYILPLIREDRFFREKPRPDIFLTDNLVHVAWMMSAIGILITLFVFLVFM